ncbi:uncharacterized protein LOC116915939 [Daphnia magna]|uniref:Uncharacterized protein n=1 Tax=Daphnia magna TaxID=35525 RepID=A0ABR0A2A4_9CRUS|nr:uncharacterized protein LOC116915939 [Daphnia magna]KAK4019296.1 hypothetical protein OUZ56_001322 [Daphnia magna]
MRLTFACLLVLGAVAVAYADPEPQVNPQPSFDQSAPVEADGRTFYTVTLTFSTSTTFTTTTRTSTCTTSTGGLSVCTASGRRRRGLHLSGNKEGRGLFYNDNEETSEDGTIFLPSDKSPESEVVAAKAEPVRVERAPVAIPYVIQPGFSAPSGAQPRVLLAFSTVTTTSTSTTTTVTSLTAICQSTTGFQVCGSNGK